MGGRELLDERLRRRVDGASGPDGKIAFNNADATFFQINYSAYSEFHLEGYDFGNLTDSDSVRANLRYINGNENGPGTLRVDAPSGKQIAYVMLHDMGNYWVVDNAITDATGISGGIPEPASVIIWRLVGLLAISIGFWRRKPRP